MDKQSMLCLLKSLEWTGMIYGMALSDIGGSTEMEACPSCHGAKPSPMAMEQLRPEYVGHKEGCFLMKAIKELETTKVTKNDRVRDWINDEYSEALVMDGYDEAILGMCQRFGYPAPVVAYDREKVIAILMKDGMSLEEAIEFHEYNQLGAWVGESTPVFIDFAPTENP